MNRRTEWIRTGGKTWRWVVTEDVEVPAWIYALRNVGQLGTGGAQPRYGDYTMAYKAENHPAPQPIFYGVSPFGGIFGGLF